jgi:hypothetical protein
MIDGLAEHNLPHSDALLVAPLNKGGGDDED